MKRFRMRSPYLSRLMEFHKGPGPHPSGSSQDVHAGDDTAQKPFTGRGTQKPLFDKAPYTIELPEKLSDDIELVGDDLDETWNEMKEYGDFETDMTAQEFINRAWNYTDEETGTIAKVEKVTARYEEIKVEGNFYDKDGERVGHFERTLNKYGEVDHAYLKLDDDLTGSGIGIRFFENSEDAYLDAGVRGIMVHANIDVGGYAWAKCGFSWDERQTDGSFETSEFIDYWNSEYGDDSDAPWHFSSNYEEFNFMQPYEIAAAVGPDGRKIGKDFLLDGPGSSSRDWHGVKILDEYDPGFQIGESYYETKGIK